MKNDGITIDAILRDENEKPLKVVKSRLYDKYKCRPKWLKYFWIEKRSIAVNAIRFLRVHDSRAQ